MIKVRFAPSPTGKLHLGSARTAVFNWLYAKHTGGKLILRIEDTDMARSEKAYTDSIIHDMRWMGMDYDEFYKQSDRFDIYREYIYRLIKEGKAYFCSCVKDELAKRHKEKGLGEDTLKYDRYCKGNNIQPEGNFVVRLDIGDERYITFKDAVKNKISVSTKELDDFVILKSDGTPTYNFAVVIDDALMDVNTVIRGEDHITNTFKQIILYEYLGFPIPRFAHLPLVMGKDKAPLSKRKGSTNIEHYRAEGILPEALLNAIARLGWSHGNDEVFTLEELIQYFDIEKLNKSNAVYDEEKMIWVNGKHMKNLPLESVFRHFEEFIEEAHLAKAGKMSDPAWLKNAVTILRARHFTLKSLYDECFPYAVSAYEIDETARDSFDSLMQNPDIKNAYNQAKEKLTNLTEYSILDGLDSALRSIAEANSIKFGDLIQTLRFTLTGKSATPDFLSVIRLLGKDIKERLG